MAEERRIGTVLVVGAGISGIKAAMELAETGYKVVLTDISPQIGGILTMLDYQFPNDHCGMCRLLPMIGREAGSQFCLRKGMYHDNIQILASTDVSAIEGDVGAYKAQLVTKPTFINQEICCECGKCIEACPVETKDAFNQGLTLRKAIYQPIPHSTPGNYVLDTDTCTRCGKCVEACRAGAINLDAEATEQTVIVQAIIFASGVKLHGPHTSKEGQTYTVSPDVVTSLQFERMLSGSGTYDGSIRRPSDGKEAKKFAWIQCVGSRNRHQKTPFCSSTCCMFALKEAVLAHKKGGEGVETTIFYMDMRTFGKDFYRYQEKAEQVHGVKKIRCRVQGVRKDKDGQLHIRYFDPTTQAFSTQSFDVVILSTGQDPFERHKRIAELTGTQLNEDGLLVRDGLEKVCLSKAGLFVCGSVMGLTDISEAISSSTAAAGKVSELLSSMDVQFVETESGLPPSFEENELPALALVLCACSKKMGSRIQGIDLLADTLRQLPGVADVHVIDTLCMEEGHEKLRSLLATTKGNRILIGACSQYIYTNRLRKTITQAGINPSLVKIFDFLGLMDHHDLIVDEETVHKVIQGIRPDMESLRYRMPLHGKKLPVDQKGLIVGGGISGMTAAISLAQCGIDVALVEATSELGGYTGNRVSRTLTGLDPKSMATLLKERIEKNTHVTVHLNSRVKTSQGNLGAFETTIVDNESGEETIVNHGVSILATGCIEAPTDEYAFGLSKRILTQGEFRDKLAANDPDTNQARTIVMIQCVGSREKGKKEYCSRVCCQAAVANALIVKERNPDARVVILYRDMMTYGEYEKYYTLARKKGVIFVTYSPEEKPEVVLEDDKPLITYRETVLDVPAEIRADLLILSTGLAPSPTNVELAQAFGGLSLNQDGFFVEADSKWRPVECTKPGVYVVGTAHSPRTLPGCVVQAQAAAQKAYTFLAGRVEHSAGEISITHDALCARCQRCVAACPYEARRYDTVYHRIIVDPAVCQACGVCAATCPNNAAEVLGWQDKQMMAVLDSMLMS
jgi:heterodisulfide reductase subunit A